MSEELGPIYEAYLDGYMKQFKCSRDVAEKSLQEYLKRKGIDENQD
jgi:hypothetical protein